MVAKRWKIKDFKTITQDSITTGQWNGLPHVYSTNCGCTESYDMPVLEPLHLDVCVAQEPSRASDLCGEHDIYPSSTVSGPCPLCDQMFDTADQTWRKLLAEHLLHKHKLVIGEIELIADFLGYLRYWKERFKDNPLTDFCTSFDAKQKNPGTEKVQYYLLCDVLPEDKDLRQFLQQQKLTKVLECQQRERNGEDFSRDCLFCRQHFTGRRADLINHMAQDHSFNVGQPDNLVFVDEFIGILQTKLSNLQCLYCEKTFKDRLTLKEHMRKKLHRRINPKNRVYDKFYVINYLELGRNWESIQSEDDEDIEGSDDSTEKDDDWAEWHEDPGAQAVCLFCDYSSSSGQKLSDHMKELHNFDLEEMKTVHQLDFYQQVKLINYIRRQIHQCCCYGCQQKLTSKQEVLDHMHEKNHTSQLPQMSHWDQPQYFFPTYENDNLLCQLEERGSEGELTTATGGQRLESRSHSAVSVIPEDVPILDRILNLQISDNKPNLSE